MRWLPSLFWQVLGFTPKFEIQVKQYSEKCGLVYYSKEIIWVKMVCFEITCQGSWLTCDNSNIGGESCAYQTQLWLLFENFLIFEVGILYLLAKHCWFYTQLVGWWLNSQKQLRTSLSQKCFNPQVNFILNISFSYSLVISKSSNWFTEKHIFKIIIYNIVF